MLVSRYAATFAGTPQSVTCARKRIWDYLADCPLADDACLIVSEFASNAVLHSLSRIGTFTVRCERFSTYIWVEVEDDGGDWCRPEPDGRPHGLDIVSLLVGEGGWGIERQGNGQCITWARLELADRETSSEVEPPDRPRSLDLGAEALLCVLPSSPEVVRDLLPRLSLACPLHGLMKLTLRHLDGALRYFKFDQSRFYAHDSSSSGSTSSSKSSSSVSLSSWWAITVCSISDGW